VTVDQMLWDKRTEYQEVCGVCQISKQQTKIWWSVFQEEYWRNRERERDWLEGERETFVRKCKCHRKTQSPTENSWLCKAKKISKPKANTVLIFIYQMNYTVQICFWNCKERSLFGIILECLQPIHKNTIIDWILCHVSSKTSFG